MALPAAGCSWAFPLPSLSLAKTPQQGPSQDFWPDEKSLPRNYSCLSRLKLQSRPGASRCAAALLRWLLVGSKAEERTQVGAHPRPSAVVYIKQAGRRHYRRPSSTFVVHIHIPFAHQSFTARPITLAELCLCGAAAFILLISPPRFSAQNLRVLPGAKYRLMALERTLYRAPFEHCIPPEIEALLLAWPMLPAIRLLQKEREEENHLFSGCWFCFIALQR
ncbi:hypothetical protein ACQKWADRAFT_101720 [Trichoderma austrokoningii]